MGADITAAIKCVQYFAKFSKVLKLDLTRADPPLTATQKLRAKKRRRSEAALKAWKVMKSKKVSFIAKGPRAKTSSGFKKTDLMKSKTGKIVTKTSYAAGRKAYKN